MNYDLIIICLGLLMSGALIGCPIAYNLGYRDAQADFRLSRMPRWRKQEVHRWTS